MNKEKFLLWLQKNGAQVLAPTNAYELARFRARGGVHVIYQGRRGISASGFAGECLSAFQGGRPLDMGIVSKPRGQYTRIKAALAHRDGMECFYCGGRMVEDSLSVEHLVSLDKGGPNHTDNFVLTHPACNAKAGNLPLVEKIKLRDKMRGDRFGAERPRPDGESLNGTTLAGS